MVLSKTEVLKVKTSVLTLLLSVMYGNTLAITDFRQHLERRSCTPEREIFLFFFLISFYGGA